MNPIPNNALEWLKLVRGAGKLTPPNYAGRMRYIREGFKGRVQTKLRTHQLRQPSCRHVRGCCKDLIVAGAQEPIAALETYRALVNKEDAKRYWRITPTYDGGGEIGRMVSAEEVSSNRMKRLAAAVN